MRDIRPIKSEVDYDWALAEIAGYFEAQPEPGSEEAQRFDVLADLIEAYEARVWPIEDPDPVEAIKVRLVERGMTQADLGRLLGSRSRASEILSRQRAITKEQAHRLHQELGIPAEVLIKPYKLERDPKVRISPSREVQSSADTGLTETSPFRLRLRELAYNQALGNTLKIRLYLYHPRASTAFTAAAVQGSPRRVRMPRAVRLAAITRRLAP